METLLALIHTRETFAQFYEQTEMENKSRNK